MPALHGEALACLGLPEGCCPSCKARTVTGFACPVGAGRTRLQPERGSRRGLHLQAGRPRGVWSGAAPPTPLHTGFGGCLRPLVAARHRRQESHRPPGAPLSLGDSRLPREVDLLHPPSVWGTRAGPPSPCTAAAPGCFPGSWIRSLQQQGSHLLAGALGLVHGSSQPRSHAGGIEGVPAGTGSLLAFVTTTPDPSTVCLDREPDNKHFRFWLQAMEAAAENM